MSLSARLPLALAASLLVVQAAQQVPSPAPPAPQQRPTFRGGANVVRVDVAVHDHHGEPVRTLTKDDFQIEEDGIPQTVQSFQLIEATGQPTDTLSLPIRSREHATAEAARDDIRVFLIFWDEYHLDRMVSAYRGREALSDFVKNAFGPTDLVALMDQLTPLDAIEFTRDRDALAEQVKKLQGRLGVYSPPRSVIEEAQLRDMRDIEAIRSEVTTSALEAAIVHLGAIRQGRKEVLFVSEDIGPMASYNDRYSWLDRMIRTANDNNTAIYTLDPRGLGGRRSDVLQSLAEQTGGKAFLTNNAPARALRQIVKDASAFYLLGYVSTQNPTDGRFHRIKVRLRQSGLDVKARTGYVAPSLAEMATARAAAAAAVLPPPISDALADLVPPRDESTGDLWIGAAPATGGRSLVTIAWSPRDGAAAPSPSSGSPVKEAAPPRTVSAIAADGETAFDGPLHDNLVAFVAPSGALRVRVTSTDDNGVENHDTRTFDVPDYRDPALKLTSPVVLRARTGLELRQFAADDNPPPYAGREFDRRDRVLVRFTVVGQAAGDAVAGARLLSRRGRALSTLPLTKRSGTTYVLDFPMATVSRGDYIIELTATHGQERAQALVPLRSVS